MINYEHLYNLHEEFSYRNAFRAGPEDITQDLDALTPGAWKPSIPIIFEHETGNRISDVIWTTYPPLVLISSRFCEVLERAEFTGWSTYQVRVFDESGDEIQGYLGLAIIGRTGPVDLSRSQKVWREPKHKGGPKYQEYVGMFFKNDQWDGSDLFLPENTLSKIVTAEVKDALSGLNIPNVAFDRLSEYTRHV